MASSVEFSSRTKYDRLFSDPVYLKNLQRIAVRWLGEKASIELAEDLIQDALESTYRNHEAHTAEDEKTFRRRVYVTLYKRCVVIKKQLLQESENKNSWSIFDRSDYLAEIEETEPEERIVKQEEVAVIQKALSELKPRHLEILCLMYLDGYKQVEIQEHLQLAAATIKLNLIQAHAAIREKIPTELQQRMRFPGNDTELLKQSLEPLRNR